jgi:single-strand DNA-binding protein
MNLNHLTLSGHLTRDPEVRQVGQDRAVAHFTLANNRRYKGADGEIKEETLFLDAEAWGRTAELAGQYLTKGSHVIAEGRLRLDQWTDKDGNKRSRVKVVCDQLHFLDRKGERSEREGEPTAAVSEEPRPARQLRTQAAGHNDEEPPF